MKKKIPITMNILLMEKSVDRLLDRWFVVIYK